VPACDAGVVFRAVHVVVVVVVVVLTVKRRVS
jgi:hypothetical protein